MHDGDGEMGCCSLAIFSLRAVANAAQSSKRSLHPHIWLVSNRRPFPTRRSVYGDLARLADVFTGTDVLFSQEPLFL